MKLKSFTKRPVCMNHLPFVFYLFLGLNDVNKSILDDGLDDQIELEDDEEQFYTPPSSPSLLEPLDENEDDFVEAELPTCEIFLEGYVFYRSFFLLKQIK